jgi:Ca2+-binding EF-hand superfamily protein
MKIRTLMMAVAIIALTGGMAHADITVGTTTTVKEVPLPGVKTFDINSFDDNHDGVITVEEAGDHLFHLFDLNDDGVIDNKEFEKKTIVTVMPLQKTTYMFRDVNGQTQTGQYSYDTFMKRSGLAQFGGNKDGMSPHDFVKKSFLQMDTNHDGVITPDEWRAAYVASHTPSADQAYRYNN